jgi:hypothetical protein
MNNQIIHYTLRDHASAGWGAGRGYFTAPDNFHHTERKCTLHLVWEIGTLVLIINTNSCVQARLGYIFIRETVFGLPEIINFER